MRPVEQIHVGCRDQYTGRVDKPAIKDVTGQGYLVVTPYRPPHHSCIGSQAYYGLSQRRVRLSYDRKGAAHSDENPGYRRVFVAGVPAHDDVADSADSRTRGVADRAAKQRFCEALMVKYGKPDTDRPKGFFPRIDAITVYAISVERMTGKEMALPALSEQWPAKDRTKTPNARP